MGVVLVNANAFLWCCGERKRVVDMGVWATQTRICFYGAVVNANVWLVVLMNAYANTLLIWGCGVVNTNVFLWWCGEREREYVFSVLV